MAEFSGCITKRSPVGLSRLLGSYQSINLGRRPAPSLRSMNSAILSLKKIQMLDLRSDRFYCWQGAWLCLWQQVDLEARGLFKQLKYLPTMGYGTDFLITYEHLIPKALNHQGKTFTTQIESLNSRLRHYLAHLHRRSLC